MNIKKILAVALIIFVMISAMSGCVVSDDALTEDEAKHYTIKDEPADTTFAVVSIRTSTGYAESYFSYHYNNRMYTGLVMALAQEKFFFLDEGETVNVSISCTQCDCEKAYTLTAPAAKVLSCNCTETDGIEGYTEYFAVSLCLPGSESCLTDVSSSSDDK